MTNNNDQIDYEPINDPSTLSTARDDDVPADNLVLEDWSTVFQNHKLIQDLHQKSGTVRMTREIFKPGPVVDGDPTIAFPQIPKNVLDQVSNTLPDESINLDDPAIKQWFQTVGEADLMEAAAGQYQGALKREGAQWTQGLDNGNIRLGLSRMRVRDTQTEDRAVLRVLGSLGMGGLFSLPLWHSGFWITLKTPQNSALMDLEMRIIREKRRFARQTYGRVLSNTTAFANSILLDFVLDHVHSTNLESREAMRDLILAQDLHVLAWELASIIYPRGFNYRRPILGDRDATYKYIEERIEVAEMNWVDSSSLTPEQVTHISKRTGTVTIDEVKRYQAQFALSVGRSFRITDTDVAEEEQTYVHLRTPTAVQYVDMGMRWINDISRTYDSIGRSGQTAEERDRYIESQAASTVLRRYEHYIDKIVIRSVDGTEDDVTADGAKARILDYLSGDPIYRKRFDEEIRRFIDDTTISIVAVTVYDPEERAAVRELPRFPYLIPVDPVGLFFTLLIRRNNIMRARATD